MKKIILLPVCLVMTALTVKAQKEPPPPPPKIVVEKVKVSTSSKKVDVKYKVPPVITITGKKADEFYERNPNVASISRQGDIVKLTMKDNTTQKYDFTKTDDKKTFKDSYGEVPIPGPPPPPKRIDVKVRKTPPPPPPPKPGN